jgi:predicted permease
MMDWLRHDVAHAVRSLARRPGYTALVVFALALGLGANMAAFSVVNALLFRSSRTPDATRIGWLFVRTRSTPDGRASTRTLDALSAHATTLASVGAEGRAPVSCELGGALSTAWALVVSADYFDVVRPPLAAGRTLSPVDVRAAATDVAPVLLSERFWTDRTRRTHDLSTISIRLNGQPVAVMGVVRDDFQGPGGLFAPDLWIPLDAAPRLRLGSAFDRDAPTLTLLARPRSGISITAVDADVRAIALAESETAKEAANRLTVDYVPVRDGHPDLRGFVTTTSMLAMLAAAIVLAVACFNAASLALARAFERRRDLGVRAAMGAGRWRLIRALLTEGAITATAGGALALVLASWTNRVVDSLSLPAPIPQRLLITLDGRVMAFGVLATTIAAVLPAFVPAWQVLRGNPLMWIHAGAASAVGSRRDRRVQRRFIVAQMIASTVFLVAAFLLAQSFHASSTADLGFNVANTAIAELDPARDQMSSAQRHELADALVERLRASPDVLSVALADRAPFFVGSAVERRVSTDGSDCRATPTPCPSAIVHMVGPSYFDALAIPPRAGRVFDAHDTDDAVVVDETAATTLWPGRTAVGARFLDGRDRRSRIVIGVVADNVHRVIGEGKRPHIYTRLTDADFAHPVTVIVRGRGGADRAAASLLISLRTLDPAVAPPTPQTMASRLALPLWPTRVGTSFFGACAVVALLLALVGLFGMTYYAVNQRRREFGVRLAIGATQAQLRRLILGESVRLIAPGVLVGLIVAAGLAALARRLLYGVSTLDWRVYVLAGLVQFAVAVVASWMPARRASATDPWSVLRTD